MSLFGVRILQRSLYMLFRITTSIYTCLSPCGYTLSMVASILINGSYSCNYSYNICNYSRYRETSYSWLLFKARRDFSDHQAVIMHFSFCDALAAHSKNILHPKDIVTKNRILIPVFTEAVIKTTGHSLYPLQSSEKSVLPFQPP